MFLIYQKVIIVILLKMHYLTYLQAKTLKQPKSPSTNKCVNEYSAYTKQKIQFSAVQFSASVVSDFLPPHELQHARPPCPSPTHYSCLFLPGYNVEEKLFVTFTIQIMIFLSGEKLYLSIILQCLTQALYPQDAQCMLNEWKMCKQILY